MKPIITYLQSEAVIKEDFDNRYNNLDNFDKAVFQHLYMDYKYDSDFENQTLLESGRLPKDIEETIRGEYNNICNTELGSSKVFKKLRFLIDRSIKKFDRIIGKLCLESLGNQKYIYTNHGIFYKTL